MTEEIEKNHFEEVIDNLMLDQYSDEPELTEFIKTLPNDKKRLAILSLLDKDNNMWTKLKSMIGDNTVSKMDHIKDVVLMLREYVKIAEVEKKKFGEVMTPLDLVKEMLATLPKEVWSNPNLKWLDPANGTGPFPIMVIYKLMKGLEKWQPNEELRYKHIIENMIYVCELQPKNMFLYLCAIDPKDEYDCKIYTGSFLDEVFDFHMKNVWNVDKFDIIIGNPPYNNEVSLSGTSSDLYDHFIFKSDKISDSTLMVTPSKWFNKPDKKNLRDLLINKGKLCIIVTKNTYFDELNIRGGVSYFLTNKENNKTVLFNNIEKDLKSQLESFGFIFMEQSDSDIITNILSKFKNEISLSSIFNSQSYFGLKTNHRKLSLDGKKCYFSGRQKKTLNLLTDNGRHFSYVDEFKDTKNKLDRWKLITPAAYGFKTKDNNTYNQIGHTFISSPGEICTETFVFFDLENRKECENLKAYLETKFVKFLVALRKNKQHVTSKIFEIIPMVSLEREWTDEELFDYFDLTEEEKKIILG
jgi:site-specific DNA-methyltransferase (adenine-specific)